MISSDGVLTGAPTGILPDLRFELTQSKFVNSQCGEVARWGAVRL